MPSRVGLYILANVLPARDGMRNGKVNCVTGAPQRDDIAEAKEDHGKCINPFGPLYKYR